MRTSSDSCKAQPLPKHVMAHCTCASLRPVSARRMNALTSTALTRRHLCSTARPQYGQAAHRPHMGTSPVRLALHRLVKCRFKISMLKNDRESDKSEKERGNSEPFFSVSKARSSTHCKTTIVDQIARSCLPSSDPKMNCRQCGFQGLAHAGTPAEPDTRIVRIGTKF